MARTRTAGIQVEADGSKVVDKRVFGVRIKCRLGKLDQDQAEACLVTAINVAGMSRLRPHSATRMSYLADRTFVLDIESGASFGQRIEYGSVPVGRYLVLAIALALG